METHDSLAHGEVENPFLVHVLSNNLNFPSQPPKTLPKVSEKWKRH